MAIIAFDPPPGMGVLSGEQLVLQAEALIKDVAGHRKGSARPSDVQTGELWLDDSASPWVLKLWDGASDIPVMTVDPALHALALSGLTIGTDVQGYSDILAALAGLSPSASKLPYFTGASAMALTTLTSLARTLLAGADAAAMRSTLELGSAALATLGTAANNALQLNASAKIASTAYDFASTATMEAGTNTTQPANAAGVAAAIDALAPDGGGVGTTINTSRAMTAATGSVNYSTGESTKTPKAAFIFYHYDANNWGWSYADGASGFLYGKLTGAEYFQWDTQVIAAQPSSGNVQRVAASAVSFSLGRVTLSWVKVGSPTGTLYLKIVPLY